MPWELTGNAGINASNDFLGTTDSQPLVIKSNGLERMRITSNGDIGVGTANPSFGKLEISSTGDRAFLVLDTTSGANKRTRLNFSQSGVLGMEVGTDYFQNNTDDLYIYSRATGQPAA